MSAFIYSLVDPETDSVFYIGKANDPQKRLKSHMSLVGNNRYKNNKIKKILRRGYSPKLVILEECTPENWKSREQYWIAYGKKNNWPLTNLVNGGEGVDWDYMKQVAAPYFNPTRDDFVGAIKDIIHPVNHTPVESLSFDGLVRLGQAIARYLIST